MLAPVPTGWFWLLAAAVTVVHAAAMARWIPLRRFRYVYPCVIVACGAGAVLYGRSDGYTLPSMLAMYAFSIAGLTIGLFPTRRLFTAWAREMNNGVTRERYDVPPAHIVFCVGSVVVMALAAFALTR
ncbi:hypothetical protein [Streptomyces sp. NPDC058653]|uniref:hypothetical protein n=1 Tax=Streptomyces sp. NPDC058653 TaxID=3346576 RepID=UPI00364D5101